MTNTDPVIHVPCDAGTGAQLTIIGVDRTRFELIGAGAPISMTDDSSRIRGVGGSVIRSETVGRDVPGEMVRNVRARVQTITVPLITRAADLTETGLDAAIDALARWLPATEGQCTLIWRRPDGTARQIDAHYESGAETLVSGDLSRQRSHEPRIVFRASFPYWRPLAEPVVVYEGTLNDGFFGGANSFPVTNPGDVSSWPTIEFHNPTTGEMQNIEVGNLSVGKRFRIWEIIESGSTVRVESDPRARECYLDLGFRQTVLDPAASTLWEVEPGVNHLFFRAWSPDDACTYKITIPVLHTSS